MKKLIFLLLAILLITPIAFATTDEIRFYGEQNQPLDVKEQCFNDGAYCSNAAVCNLTIYNPDMSTLIYGKTMTNNIAYHNWTLTASQTANLGVYESTVMCTDGADNNFDTFYYQVTYNGNPEPSDFTKVAFMIFFMIILIMMVLSIINVALTGVSLTTNFKDIAISYCSFFAVLALKNFNITYGNNYLIDTFSDLFISVGVWTHIFIPLVALILSMTVGVLIRKRRKEREEP